MTQKMLFNKGWQFHKTAIGQQPDDLRNVIWTPVDLPHDWLIGQVHNLYESSEGWYRNTLEYNPAANEQISLCFDGVYMDSTLYINDREVGSWKYGYSSFEFLLTPHLTSGSNQIKLRVRHQAPNSRWYSGAGIYRNVWLRYTPDIHFQANGIYLHTDQLNCDDWLVTVRCEVGGSENYIIRHQLLNQAGKTVATATGETFTISRPHLWSPESPCLYHLHSQLLINDLVTDEAFTTFGFRTLEFTADRGLILNRRPYKLKGVCLHHDLGALGAAFHPDAARRQLRLMQDMGANAIRTAHNMPAPELLELADQIGFLVVNEAFDMWKRPKTKFDYARFFPEYAAQDVASWVRRDRNHPCVILWSVGNEIYDTHADEQGQETLQNLIADVKLHDPLGNALPTIGSNYMPWENAQKCADIVNIAGYNYSENLYAGHHRQHPGRVIYGSETASLVQSRGIYHFPLNCPILSDDDHQCSSLGNSTTSWGAKSLEFCALTERDTPYSLGQFIWAGIDYLGEPTPYHTKNSYFGQVDTAGFPKDSYYFYQSMWTDYRKSPMIHLLPYWDFNEGQQIDVRIYSNAPMVELFLNGTSLGRQQLEHQAGHKVIGDWTVAYQKGELKAVAYDEQL